MSESDHQLASNASANALSTMALPQHIGVRNHNDAVAEAYRRAIID